MVVEIMATNDSTNQRPAFTRTDAQTLNGNIHTEGQGKKHTAHLVPEEGHNHAQCETTQYCKEALSEYKVTF